MKKEKALKWLCIFILMGFLTSAFLTYLFDPFYQYHAPFFGMEPVLHDRDNQVPGSLRTLSYDRVLLGSSVAENFDTGYLDEPDGGRTLKVIRASGSVADLLYYLDSAHAHQKLREVYWCLDIFALTSSPEVTLYSKDTPRYLHTETVLDDFPYLFNKDILFQEIPLQLASSCLHSNTGGHAYDWSGGKTFSAEKAMQAYQKPEQPLPPQPCESELMYVEENISMILAEVNAHPDIPYTFLLPPYSMLWWDCGYTNGISDRYFYVLEKTLPELLSCPNVSVYFFQSDENIICNLDNYMDMIHYSPEINQYMLECVASDSHNVTGENQKEVLTYMKEVFEDIIENRIYEYYPRYSG